ncbi:raffinose/stachyose/melibiose transport system substrate-binding protein [Microbacterium phyllosphaerae]|uniref:Raffinose/stachyose/melibiose transport system substrate-binding protein n=1 Tax=Microbacterium phyllosphaerae TaxID=124798 RepID=A0ABS4WUL9_9MICO|nr:ABC transporter substrate-binding protein [Microbacterium phyllosphaerae]MBP2379907.1 raffinose/stachyose/melibiose transport system substrate-binding protein [Microbacterium phyllosphaerae]
MRIRHRKTARGVAMAAALGTVVALGGCASPPEDGITTLSFFQFKGEALEDFDAIIADFEAENPDIRVVQNQVADSETLIRTLLVKDKAPDVITLNANGGFGDLAQAGVFYDFSDEPVLETINPAVQEILAELGTKQGEVNGLGYVNNANGVIYNQDIFEEQGLEVPETWDEFIAVCDALEAAGIAPFYGTLADSWTGMPSWNALGAYASQDGFFDDLRAEGEDVGADSAVSFENNFPEVMAQQAQLFSYMQEGYRGRTYDDGNAAFARGESAMLLQGIWALNPVKAINPDINAAIFPYPAADEPDDRLLVSGVDVVVTMAKDTPHREEALRFIEYLFDVGVIEEFAASQNMIPSVKGAELSDDPALQSVKPFFDEGKITGFIDHQVPPSIPLVAIVQQFLFDGDADAALSTLDSEWRKVAARTIPVTGDEE